IVLNCRLQVSVSRWLLPKRVRFWAGQPSPRFLRIAPSSLSTISSRKKSARELRQRRSDYRCCIPALAGFVSPQSIAPDGGKTFAQDHYRATGTRERSDQNDKIQK